MRRGRQVDPGVLRRGQRLRVRGPEPTNADSTRVTADEITILEAEPTPERCLSDPHERCAYPAEGDRESRGTGALAIRIGAIAGSVGDGRTTEGKG